MIATVVLVITNVVICVAMAAKAGLTDKLGFDRGTLYLFGANHAGRVLDEGEVWRLFTSTLIHLNLMHIAMNMIALVQVGRALEPRWGGARVIAAYAATGVLASVASVLWYAAGGAEVPPMSAGASGAICGLVGAAAVSFHRIGTPAGRRQRDRMLVWAAIVIATGFFIGADNAAHIGGLVAGLAMGFIVERVGFRGRTGRLADVVAIVVFLALAGAAFAVALTRPDTLRVYT